MGDVRIYNRNDTGISVPERPMNHDVKLRAVINESQSKLLQERLKIAAILAAYNEEQHGATLVVEIRCGAAQDKAVRQILYDVGALLISPS